ncbi:MAG: DeoR/GlpR family DNA-binding transcription regulator [Actinomycetota bacterium]|nr:DeoR/GlpR family DNA-binding transcription regulator [Actinomycetota bacterium]
MPADFRRAQMLERIRRDGGASVGELARDYGVSPITIHRDLDRLAQDGLVKRVRGGAQTAVAVPHVETDWAKRLRQATAAKEAIAARASAFVGDGSTIFVDSSTTCLALARHLARRPPRALTLVTNSPAIAVELHAESIHIVVTPGEVDQTLRMIGGRWASDFLGALHLETAFVSAAGITLEHGLTTTRRTLADTLHAARAVASQTIGLVDSSKFGRTFLLSIARAEELDALVVDDALDLGTLESYTAADVNVVLAETNEARPTNKEGKWHDP